MKNSEFNIFDENQKTEEYQYIEAIQTSFNNKESHAPKNEIINFDEIRNNQKNNKKRTEKDNKKTIRKLIQKVTETTSTLASSIAITATIAIISVVMFTSILIKAPNVELLNLVSGYDYVSYNLYIDEMDEKLIYYSVISNNFENYRYELVEGENINTINNLQHNMKYELSVVGVGNDSGGDIEYFKVAFYTTEESKIIEVKWIVEGIVVEEDEIEYGQTPEYNGTTPIKESTNETNYTFKEWEETKEENGNINYNAIFESSIRTYQVKWIVEGIVVEEDEIEYGQTPEYNGTTPIKEMTIDEEYEFISWDKELSPITENTIFNAVFNTIQHEYTATYNQLNASDVIINYDDPNYHILTFNTGFDNSSDSRLSYRIILTDINTDETYIYEGTDSIASINVLPSVTALSITYENIGTYNGVVKIFESIEKPEILEISEISLQFNDDIILSATDEYQLSLVINSNFETEEVYNSLTLFITYDDSSTNEIIIDDVVVNEVMNINVSVPAYCSSFTIDYELDLLGVNGHNPRIISGTKDFMLESSFELVRIHADTNDYFNAKFIFKYHFVDEETTIAVKDSISSTVTTKYEGADYIETSLDVSSSQQEFTYYLSDLNGLAKGPETAVVINTATVKGEYNFQYVNPGDAIVTFNDDGTMNIYLNTVFETEDADIFYLIRYTDFDAGTIYDIKYTESIAYLENIPFSNYGIEYYVYKTIDGIDYQLYSVFVSGGIEITYDNICHAEIQEDGAGNIGVYISYDDYRTVNPESFVLTIDGVKYQISSSDIVLNGNVYEAYYPLTSEYTELILEYEASYNDKMIYDLIVAGREIKGTQYRKMYVVL